MKMFEQITAPKTIAELVHNDFIHEALDPKVCDWPDYHQGEEINAN